MYYKPAIRSTGLEKVNVWPSDPPNPGKSEEKGQ